MGHYLTIKISLTQNQGPKLFYRNGGGERLRLLAPLLALCILLSTIFNPHISDFYFPQTMPIQYPILFKYPLAALIVVRLLSHVQLLVTSWTAAHLGPLSYAISRSLLKLVH